MYFWYALDTMHSIRWHGKKKTDIAFGYEFFILATERVGDSWINNNYMIIVANLDT